MVVVGDKWKESARIFMESLLLLVVSGCIEIVIACYSMMSSRYSMIY